MVSQSLSIQICFGSKIVEKLTDLIETANECNHLKDRNEQLEIKSFEKFHKQWKWLYCNLKLLCSIFDVANSLEEFKTKNDFQMILNEFNDLCFNFT